MISGTAQLDEVDLTVGREEVVLRLECTMMMHNAATFDWQEYTFQLYSNRELLYESTQPPHHNGEIDLRDAAEVRDRRAERRHARGCVPRPHDAPALRRHEAADDVAARAVPAAAAPAPVEAQIGLAQQAGREPCRRLPPPLLRAALVAQAELLRGRGGAEAQGRRRPDGGDAVRGRLDAQGHGFEIATRPPGRSRPTGGGGARLDRSDQRHDPRGGHGVGGGKGGVATLKEGRATTTRRSPTAAAAGRSAGSTRRGAADGTATWAGVRRSSSPTSSASSAEGHDYYDFGTT